jgi:hypothetical protein
MVFKTTVKKIAILTFFALMLSACGGGGSGTADTTAPNAPLTKDINIAGNGLMTIKGTAEAGSTVTVTFPDGSSKFVISDTNGNYVITSDTPQNDGVIKITSEDSGGNISNTTTIDSADKTAPSAPTSVSLTSTSDGSITVTGAAEPNSTVTVTFPDGSQKTATADTNGIINFTLTSIPSQPSGQIKITSTDANGNISETSLLDSLTITKSLYLATGIMPELSFKPSLGINTEAPQGGADTAGMPMPFVDIFRTARPFEELSPAGTQFDANGWPTEFASGHNYAKSKLLQGTLDNSIPEGEYTVLFDGNGTLEFSGSVSNVTKISGENKYTLNLNLNDFDGENEVAAADTNAFNMNVKGISSGAGNYMKNIRIVMPGGTCTGNPFIRIDSTETCPNGTSYQSFESRLQADRNAIIFNPDYLLFLRNFKVIRMMNLMEASLKKLCYTSDTCPTGVGTWDHRAKMADAVWGGNDGRTADEDHKGVPVKVMTTLANTLKRDIWVNMPHIANDDYVAQYAKQVYTELDPSLKVYLEYSNEVWNSGFAGYAYAVSEGVKQGLNTVPAEFVGSSRDGDYFARLRFYSQRAAQIFDLWETEFGIGNTRMVRVLGSFIGDKVLTEQMLKTVVTNKVDVVAIAPYFFGCPYQDICIDAPKTLLGATTVDDIFAALDQSRTIDVKSIDGTIAAIENQLTITNQYSVKLVSYEGGQHLVTGVLGSGVTADDQTRLRKLFNDANRDPRMKERYITFLNAWKNLSTDGTSLFTLYTMPQSFYRYGNFGIKEHLNKPRAESPKFDAVMSFQEAVGNCWWDESGCTP